jgi:hypothetical protein
MQELNKVDWEILNATADDRENLEQIFLAVCFEVVSDGAEQDPHHSRLRRVCAVSLGEIADRVHDLVSRGLLAGVVDSGLPLPAHADASFLWRSWFAMTPVGRQAWEASAHGNLVEQQ